MSRTPRIETDLVRWTNMHNQYTAVGIVAVLAARKLAAEGKVRIVTDDADAAGIGSVTLTAAGDA